MPPGAVRPLGQIGRLFKQPVQQISVIHIADAALGVFALPVARGGLVQITALRRFLPTFAGQIQGVPERAQPPGGLVRIGRAEQAEGRVFSQEQAVRFRFAQFAPGPGRAGCRIAAGGTNAAGPR